MKKLSMHLYVYDPVEQVQQVIKNITVTKDLNKKSLTAYIPGVKNLHI